VSRRSVMATKRRATLLAVLSMDLAMKDLARKKRPFLAVGAHTDLTLTDLEEAVARLRKQSLEDFDPVYVEHVVIPHFLDSTYQGERLFLPMIDLNLTKENAMPSFLWGLLSDSWKLNPEDGVAVFLQRLERRGPDNLRKKIYMSAMTPDLYRPMYGDKIKAFFDELLDDSNAGKPLMRPYLEGYFDVFWDLHLGVKGDAIPQRVRQIGESLSSVLAYGNPTEKIFYENYMSVRAHRSYLTTWIDERISDTIQGKTANPEKTLVHYWIKNGREGDVFSRKDVIFECVHDLFAFSQWGTTIYNIMLKLAKNTGDPDIRNWFKKAMEGNFDQSGHAAFTPLERFVMELFRTISPNAGSESALEELEPQPYQRHAYVVSSHPATSFDPRHWKDPEKFDPDRYNSVPTSDQIDNAKCQEIGFARCPFERKTFNVMDGRKAALHNSGFGTVYSVVDGKALPVCDYAGYAPFGFGYRRCPGEQFTIKVFEDFLITVWKSKVEFEQLNTPNPERLPIGPGTVIADNVGFTRTK
jgi:cytochrome P450